ncbi:MAG: relaxase domain-containing protein [Armatimonadetes bacterium]|nr:relaxase domain-containing protein [Armatimonadota bacterium]
MLSVGAMGAGQENYYLALAREDYYLEGGEPLGQWFGSGAAELGLVGTVAKNALKNLLIGLSPEGDRPLIRIAGAKEHQPGWDLTFSAPKSVSVLWAVADIETRHTIQDAHYQAVKKALEYLQDVAGITRRGRGGAEHERAGLIFATFEHGTSRALDPQLHTHALLLNVAVSLSDGKTKTIMSKPIYDNKMTAGALYRAELSAELENRLGVQCERQGTWFEVAGVPKDLSAEFSKRRAEIETFLGERGLTSAAASAYATLATRTEKGHIARSELFPKWQKIGAAQGFTNSDVAGLLNTRPVRDVEAEKQEAIRLAIERITSQESYFSQKELLRFVAEEAPGRGINAEAVQTAVKDTLTRSTEIIALGRVKGELRYTTREILETEHQILSLVVAGKTDDRHILPMETFQKTVSRQTELSEEQVRALRHITAEKGSVQVVSGMAGTGKTKMLSVAREAWEQGGYRVIGASLSGKAAQGLQEGAGIPSDTIAKFLKELDRGFDYSPDAGRAFKAEFKYATWQIDGDTRKKIRGEYHQPTSPLAHEWKYATWQIGSKQRDFLNYRLEREQYRLDEKTILVVDEAGMIGTKQMSRLIEHAAKGLAKLVLVGDAKQLQPIEVGAPFKSIANTIGQAELTEIRRQREGWARDAVHDFANGRAENALRSYAERGLLTVTADRASAMRAIVSDWQEKGGDPKDNLILTSTNHEARTLNQLIQEERRHAGKLGEDKVSIAGELVYVGDRVLFTRNSRLYGVKNGTLGMVEGIDTAKQTLLARLDNGDRRTIDIRHYEQMRLGYAVTTHKAQGVTTENVFVLAGGPMQDRELSYVQASRARGDTRFYTERSEVGDTLAHLADQMQTSRQKDIALASSLVLPEPLATEDLLQRQRREVELPRMLESAHERERRPEPDMGPSFGC